MFKKLWKLVRSDERVMQALSESGVAYDLSPDTPLVTVMPANNNEVPASEAISAPATGAKPKLWLQDWSEKDEKRLKLPHHWEGYTG